MPDAMPAKPKVKKVAKKVFKPSMETGKKELDHGNYATAQKHILPFADKGNSEAQYLMGVIFSHQDKTRDYQSAARWYDKAAQQGNADAQFSLGFLLYNGAGNPGEKTSVAPDRTLAFQYLTAAAQQNMPMAQHLVSTMLLKGEGTNADAMEALRWGMLAAEADIAESQFNVAMMLVRKPGATMDDYIQSYKWFTILAGKGYPGAYDNRGQIARYMPANAVSYAEELARNWHPSAPAAPMGMGLMGSSNMPQTTVNLGAINASSMPPRSAVNLLGGGSFNNVPVQNWANWKPAKTHPYPEVREREKYMLAN
jgi:TPR repeat protein